MLNEMKEAIKLLKELVLEDLKEDLTILNIKLVDSIKKTNTNELSFINLEDEVLINKNNTLEEIGNKNDIQITKHEIDKESFIKSEKNEFSKSNIIIYNKCLDIFSKRSINLFEQVKNGKSELNELLDYVKMDNRKNDTNTQVYLGGNQLTIFNLSNIVKKKTKLYANTSYVKPIKYGLSNYKYYTEEEYIIINKNIIKKINNDYIYNEALIDIDRTLYRINLEIEKSNFKNIDEIDRKIKYWFNYLKENKCDLNKFKKRLIYYIKENYSYDFNYIGKKEILNKVKSYK